MCVDGSRMDLGWVSDVCRNTTLPVCRDRKVGVIGGKWV